MAIIEFKDFKERLEEYEFIFKNVKEMQKHLEVIFVFGKAGTNPSDSNWAKFKNFVFRKEGTNPSDSHRAKFLNFAQQQDTPFTFLTIETLYDDLKMFSGRNGISAKRTALVDLELRAIKQAYSLVIFPESVGSYAELGYFTAIEETQHKICVANHFSFSNENSYLNHLIDVVHNTRELRPFLYDWNNPSPNDAFKSLLNKLSQDYQSTLHTENYKKNDLFPLAITYELIKIFPYLTFTYLSYATKYILKKHEINFDNEVFTVNISMLAVAGLIRREKYEGEIYFIPTSKNFSLIKYNLSETQYKEQLDLDVKYLEDITRIKID